MTTKGLPAHYDSHPPSSSEDEGETHPTSSSTDAALAAQPDSKTLLFSQTSYFPARDVEITDESGNLVYSAKTSQYTPNTPDLVFSAPKGGQKAVPIAHVFFRFAGSIKVGMPKNLESQSFDENDLNWTGMMRQSRPVVATNKAFVFDHGGREYVLTRAKGDEAGKSRGLLGHFKVVETGTGKIVGFYTSDSGIGKRKGKLNLAKEVDRELEVLIVAGIAAWREKVRRRQRFGGRMVI